MTDEQTVTDPFADFDESRTTSAPPADQKKDDNQTQTNNYQANGKYSDHLMSEKIKTRTRTFFIDLKKSVNGKFIKISELSRGQKSTIMMDAEDIPVFMESLANIRKEL